MNLKHYTIRQFSPPLLFFCACFLSFSFVKLRAAPIYFNVHAQANIIALPEALDQIAQVYKVSIIYDIGQIEKVSVKNWTMRNKSVEDDLESLLKGQPLTYKKLNEQTFVIKPSKKGTQTSGSSLEQTVAPALPIQVEETMRISGIVVEDRNDEPMIGVRIVVKGDTKGVITDVNGRFDLDTEKGKILVLSYLGFNDKTITVNQADMGTIRMEENTNQLKEIVVIGYGSQKRSDLTGALSSVSEKELKQLPSTGLDQALQGRAAGVYVTQNSGAPGGGVSIRIRGIGSTLAAEPLYVIDGVPVVNDNRGTSNNLSELDGGGQYSNALNTINPNDIESIEILKDASATAIYGARGANGVVLITTKRGTKGQSDISFDYYYGTQEISKKVPVMNLREYAAYYGEVGFQTIEEFERPELLGEGTDWQDAVFRPAPMSNYQITASGGTDRTKYALSVGLNQKDGIVVGSNFTRTSAKLNLDHSFNKRVRLGNSFLLSRTHERITFNDNSSGVVYTALLMVPSAPVTNSDGSFAGPSEEITLSFDNPVARALETNDQNTKVRSLANIYLEVDLFPWLKYRTEFGTDIVYSNHNTFVPSFERGNFFGKSGVRRSLNNSLFWVNKHLLTFNKTFAQKHSVNTLLGYETQAGKYEYLFASRENLPNNELQQLNLGDIGQQQNSGGAGHWALLSYFGRFNYGFSDKYQATGTIRVDGSSRFGPNNRYGVFPSAAVAWRVSSERFLEDIKLLNNLKFRIGVGVVGNQEIGLYSYSANIRSVNVAFGNQLLTGFSPDNIANPNVKWESSFQTNYGMDLDLVHNRISIVADYYIKQARGMLLPALLPSTAGSLNPPFVNIGAIENKGLELTLNTVNTRGKLDWRTSLNYSSNKNAVISLGSTGKLVGLIQRLPVTRTEEGLPISYFYGYQTDGIFQSQAEVDESPFQDGGTRAGDIKFKDLNKDGVVNDADQTYIGNPMPDFTLNLSNNFEYRGFDLSVFFQGVYGNEILNLVRRDIEGMAGLANQSVNVVNRYRTQQPSTTLPRVTGTDPNNNRRISDRFIEDGSFIRLRNITVGYNFSKSMLKQAKIKNLRMYASTQNLHTWTKYSGYDPEIGSYNQNPLINGVENGRYPISRSYTFGLSVIF
jgi:TonB-dependent starch-binding outer membrane protein SusC